MVVVVLVVLIMLLLVVVVFRGGCVGSGACGFVFVVVAILVVYL